MSREGIPVLIFTRSLLIMPKPFESVQNYDLGSNPLKNYQLTVTSFPFPSSIGIGLSSTSNSINSPQKSGANLTLTIPLSSLSLLSNFIDHCSTNYPFSYTISWSILLNKCGWESFHSGKNIYAPSLHSSSNISL